MQKITRKSIFSNLLKLVFITLFVGVFSQIFGTNNSLTWVCVLIGTMMYWYMDIGINIKQAPFVIVLMFLSSQWSAKNSKSFASVSSSVPPLLCGIILTL